MSIRKWFWLDGAGAMISASMIYFVLMPWHQRVGLSPSWLTGLAVAAGVFALYSLTIGALIKRPYPVFLRIIAILNTVYCLLTLSVLFLHFHAITWLGWVYFLVECSIIMLLVRKEWHACR